MRAVNERIPPELDQAITRFLEDFQSIIREHVQRALRKKGARKGVAPSAAQRARKGGGAQKRKATRARANAARRPEQLSLF